MEDDLNLNFLYWDEYDEEDTFSDSLEEENE